MRKRKGYTEEASGAEACGGEAKGGGKSELAASIEAGNWEANKVKAFT